MKRSIFFYMLLTCVVFVSCNKNQSQKSIEDQTLAEKPVSVQCYTAIYETDTIDLKINTLKNGKISGSMDMKLVNMPIKVGKISGEFRGDTLFADYSFIQGTNDKVVFKNPMAFLKSGKQFILGNAVSHEAKLQVVNGAWVIEETSSNFYKKPAFILLVLFIIIVSFAIIRGIIQFVSPNSFKYLFSPKR